MRTLPVYFMRGLFFNLVSSLDLTVFLRLLKKIYHKTNYEKEEREVLEEIAWNQRRANWHSDTSWMKLVVIGFKDENRRCMCWVVWNKLNNDYINLKWHLNYLLIFFFIPVFDVTLRWVWIKPVWICHLEKFKTRRDIIDLLPPFLPSHR